MGLRILARVVNVAINDTGKSKLMFSGAAHEGRSLSS